MSCSVTAMRSRREHRFEQREGLALIFVERVALGVAAQADGLAQMLQHDEMLAPELVERLQEHALLDLAHQIRAKLGGLARGGGIGLFSDALADLLVGDAFFLGPVDDRQVQAENLLDLVLEALGVPLLGIGIGRDVLADKLLDRLAAHIGDGLARPRPCASARCAARR